MGFDGQRSARFWDEGERSGAESQNCALLIIIDLITISLGFKMKPNRMILETFNKKQAGSPTELPKGS